MENSGDTPGGEVPGVFHRSRYAPLVIRVWSTTFSRHRAWGRLINYLTYAVGATLLGLVRRQPDVVVAATDPPVIGLAGLLISRLRRAPFVYFLWDIHPEVTLEAGIMRAGLVTGFTAWANRLAIAGAAAVVVPTADMARSAVARGADPGNVHVLPLWEDTDLVRPEARDNPFSRRHQLVDRFVLMYSGNIGLTQGLDRFLDLAERLSDLPAFTLVVVGDGASRPHLEAHAKARGLTSLRIVPYQPREDMRFSLASADVLFAPSLAGLMQYMLPSKVYTFMASGRAFVAAIDPDSDLANTVREIDCGRVVAPGDLDALEHEVRALHANPPLRAEIGQRGRGAAEARFSRAVGSARYRDLVERVSNGNRP